MSKMTDKTNEGYEGWTYYFGRGGNQQRKYSKVNTLLQNLAPRYSACYQSEKRLFAKNEVYNTVLKNGGLFFQIQNKTPVDITADEYECSTRIMQAFRDVNKHCNISPTPSRPGPSHLPSSSHKAKIKPPTTKIPSTKRLSPLMSLPPSKRRCVKPSIIEPPIMDCDRDALRKVKSPGPSHLPSSSHKAKIKPLTTKISSTKSLPPAKRRCVKSSIIELPIMDCIRDALRTVKINREQYVPDTKVEESIPEISAGRTVKPGDRSTSVSGIVSAEKSLNKDNTQHLSTNDAFDTMAVEPPKLENSFSALIMADEITADLPTDSQKSINQNLHERVQRLENLVEMLMQQQNEDLVPLLARE